jgi:putative endonuclease
MAAVYILYSKEMDRFYVGSCLIFEERFRVHLSKKHKNSFTSQANDWELFYKIEGLELSQAESIEKHIKRMKSRKYFENLRKYEQIVESLKNKYPVSIGKQSR